MPTETYVEGLRTVEDILGRPPRNYVTTLDGLYRHGNVNAYEYGEKCFIDLTVRRSGVTLMGAGDSLSAAVDDVWHELYDHLDAIDHLEGLGLNAKDLGRLIDVDEFDPEFAAPALDPAFTTVKRPTDSALTTVISPPAALPDVEPALFTVPVVEPVAAAAGEAIDTESEGYIWALLVPVAIGRA